MTILSRTFERKGRFDIGLEFLNSMLKSFFLRRGMTRASLKDCGTVPVSRQLLNILHITERTSGRHIFKRSVGIGSRRHVVLGDFNMYFSISSSVTGLSWSRTFISELR